jgi:hypothetical protein
LPATQQDEAGFSRKRQARFFSAVQRTLSLKTREGRFVAQGLQKSSEMHKM